MDLYELTAKITLDTSDYERSVSSAAGSGSSLESSLGSLGNAASSAGGNVDQLGSETEGTSSKFDAIAVAVGNFVASALTQLIAKAGEAISQITQLGIETETAFAKLQTIADEPYFEGLTEDLRALSVQTGVSAADLADVAYNAISAGADTKDAIDMVTTATQLSVAGFTDSSAALSVLSTAMNSYGEEAGTAQEISDSLIMTQNLGVTTVGDLASSIGKAIATGSAYSISLGNIEAGYIALTKSGINTRNATTYLNSMFNELGDSGSDVAAIIEENMGASFAELMESGYSLADVLQVLYDYCEGDATAMMNLWSSSNAGLAANAVLNQGLEEFNVNLGLLADSAGATQEAYDIMADTLEFKTNQMEQGFASLGLAIFGCFDDTMGSAIDFVNETFIPGLAGILDGSTDIWTATDEIFSQGTELITETLQSIIENLPQIITGIVEFLIASIPNIIEGGIQLLTGLVQSLPTATSNLVAALPELISSLVSGLISHAPEILQAGIELLGAIITAIPQIAVEVVGAVPQIIEGLVQGLLSGASAVLSAAKELGSNILSGIKGFLGINSPSTVMEEQGEYITEGLVEGITNMPMEIESILGEVESYIMDWGSNLSSGMLDSASNMSQGFLSMLQEIPAQTQSILSEALAATTSWGAEMTAQAQTVSTEFITAFNTQFATLPTTLTTHFTSALTAFTSFSTSLTSSAQTATSTVLTTFTTFGSNWTNTTVEMTTNVLTSFQTFFEELNTAFTDSTTTLLEMITQFHSDWQTQTTETTTSISTLVMEFLNNVGTSFQTKLAEILANIQAWGTEVVEQFRTIGSNAIDGMVAGLEAGAGRLYSAVRKIARQMVNEMESELDIGSPSKVFRDEVGLMVGEGLAEGIEKSESYVDRAMDNLLSVADATSQMSRSIGQYSASEGSKGQSGVTVVQNIYSQAQTAADLMREARWQQQRAVLMGV